MKIIYTGHAGVRIEKDKFRAYIKVNYKQVGLGLYTTADKASSAYSKARQKYFGEFA